MGGFLAYRCWDHQEDGRSSSGRSSSRFSSPVGGITAFNSPPLGSSRSSGYSVSSRINDGSYCNFYSAWLCTHLKALARIICLNDIFNQWCTYSGIEPSNSRKSIGVFSGNFNLKTFTQPTTHADANSFRSNSRNSSSSSALHSTNKSSAFSNSSRLRNDDSLRDDFDTGESKFGKSSDGEEQVDSDANAEDEGERDESGSGGGGGGGVGGGVRVSTSKSRRKGALSDTYSNSNRNYYDDPNESPDEDGNFDGYSNQRKNPLIDNSMDSKHMNFKVRSCFLKFQELILSR